MNRTVPLVIVVVMALGAVRIGQAQGLESPRLRALEENVSTRGTAAEDAFWEEVGKSGAPLLERADEYPGHLLVTFLWRGDANTKHVVVDGHLGQLTGTRRTDNLMQRLGTTFLWYRSYWLRNDVRTTYRLGANASLMEPDPVNAGRQEQGYSRDPLNLREWDPPRNPTAVNPQAPTSLLELPKAVPQPWIRPRSGVPSGRLEQIPWTSTLMKNQRNVWVYTPAGYQTAGSRYDLVMTTDGERYTYPFRAPTTLDNLIADKRIPPVVAVFVGNAPNVPGQRQTRAFELSCNDTFVEFLAKEILPWVQSNYHVTSDPSRMIIAGASYGGLTAACAALRRPDVFGNVLSQSGSFWWRPPGVMEAEWLAKEYAAKPRANITFYMDAGLLELVVRPSAPIDWVTRPDQHVPFGPTLLHSNRHMRDVLRLKGYTVHYAEVSGGHNQSQWQGTFADGLIALIGLPANRSAR